MKLQQYMNEAGITDDAMAISLGKDRSLINRYRRGVVTPSLDVIAKIERLTAGRVSFRDFLTEASS